MNIILEHSVQDCWLESYINMNNKHSKIALNDFDKDFFKVMQYLIELLKILRRIGIFSLSLLRRNCFESEPKCQATELFSEKKICNRSEGRKIYDE